MTLTSRKIVEEVTKRTRLPKHLVRLVWKTAVEVMEEEILGQGEVRITGFLHVKPHVMRTRSKMSGGRVVPTIRVSASVAGAFRRKLKEIIIPEGD